MKKHYLALIFIALVALLFLFVNFNGSTNSQETRQELISGNSSLEETDFATNSTSSSGINLEELSKHSAQNDCWVVYKNKVYDISNFIPNHPGGEGPITRTCGTANFESAFQKKHGTSKASMFMKVTTYKGEFVI